jgi:hypothetical protein
MFSKHTSKLLFYFYLLTSVIAISTNFSVSTLAQTSSLQTSLQNNSQNSSLAQQIKDVRTEVIDSRCQIAETWIENRINLYQKRSTDDISLYQNFVSDINVLIVELEKANIDTASLKKDVQNLDSEVQTLKTSYEKFISLLQESQQYTCGESEGKFKTAINSARSQLVQVRADKLSARTALRKVRTSLNSIYQNL